MGVNFYSLQKINRITIILQKFLSETHYVVLPQTFHFELTLCNAIKVQSTVERKPLKLLK